MKSLFGVKGLFEIDFNSREQYLRRAEIEFKLRGQCLRQAETEFTSVGQYLS